MAICKTAPKGRKSRPGLRSQVKVASEEAAWNSDETTEDEEGATSFPKVSPKSSQPPTKPITPDATAGEGIISLMRRFLNTQEQREDRYLQELRGLHESILQSIRPAEISLGVESIRMELPTEYQRYSQDTDPPTSKTPRKSQHQESQCSGLIRRCQASSRGKTSRIIFGGSSVWPGPEGGLRRSGAIVCC